MPEPTVPLERAHQATKAAHAGADAAARASADLLAHNTAAAPAGPDVQQSLQQLGDALLPHTPHWLSPLWVILLTLAAIALSWALTRIMALGGVRRARKWLVMLWLMLWVAAVLNVIFAVCFAISPQYGLPLGVVSVAMLGLIGLPWLRNITAGLAIAFEGQFALGDRIQHSGIQGNITHFGVRAVSLRAADGTLHQIPNQSFARESVTHVESEGDAACEIQFRLPPGISIDRALHLAQQAAFLTPLASPYHRPEVFLDTLEQSDHPHALQVRIRGFAFDPAWRDAFRSDVVARIHELLRAEIAPAQPHP